MIRLEAAHRPITQGPTGGKPMIVEPELGATAKRRRKPPTGGWPLFVFVNVAVMVLGIFVNRVAEAPWEGMLISGAYLLGWLYGHWMGWTASENDRGSAR